MFDGMTKEQLINSIKACAHHPKHDCESCDYCSDNFWCYNDQLIEDFEALMKEQEGIVPYIDIDEAKCPVCKVKLTRQELIGDDVLFEDFFDYCPHCGKPVLWEGR